MSVPLDRLYDFLHSVCNRDIIIYRFLPHGSKKVENLIQHNNADINLPTMICHDQEPLSWIDNQTKFGCKLREVLPPGNKYRHILLLHSEQNSSNLSEFEKDRMFPVYYWSHALIARDWFRHASVDPNLLRPKVINKDFLIYQRAWSNTREYRLKFTELLLNNNLEHSSLVKFNPIDSNIYYQNYNFVNQSLQISRYDFHDVLPLNECSSNASADYSSNDYRQTRIEVVLETLFDDTRLHLTEKILRPIACGQPFILVSTSGSLKYLRKYGFKTFNQYINEDYDSETDPVKRLNAIIQEMLRISKLSLDEKNKLCSKLDIIAKENQKLFFSQKWHDKIVFEFKENFNNAISKWGQLSQRRFKQSVS